MKERKHGRASGDSSQAERQRRVRGIYRSDYPAFSWRGGRVVTFHSALDKGALNDKKDNPVKISEIDFVPLHKR